MKIYAIILASGNGSRSGLNIPKQFYKINNKTVLEYSITAFQEHCLIDEIIVVSNPDFIDLTKDIIKNGNFSKVTKIISGGNTRQESSFKGLSQICDVNSKVLIHDAVRPFVSEKIITDCINSLDKYNAVNVAIPSSDTIIQVDENNLIKKVLKRSELRRCQTPQAFDTSLIKKAHNLANKDNDKTATDDCGLIIKYNLTDVYVVEGSDKNIKITYPADIKTAERFICE